MSTTRCQKRRNNLQESTENVSACLISPAVIENSGFLDQDESVAGPSNDKCPSIENIVLESLRISLREEKTSIIKTLLVESQKEMLKLLNPRTGENVREEDENDAEGEGTRIRISERKLKIISLIDV